MSKKFEFEFPMDTHEALVSIVMGSQSDWKPCMQFACETLNNLKIPFETGIISAHRTHERMHKYARDAKEHGLRAIIAGAGGAAHLPGMIAGITSLPVLGVPVQSKALSGQDSLLSIVQMPAGVPVGTFSIGKAGAINASLFAARILAQENSDINQALKEFIQDQTDSVPLEAYDSKEYV